MLFSSNSHEIESHPNKPLKKHLSHVIKNSLKSLSSILENSNLSDYENFLKDYLTIIGYSHDLGKSTVYFQNKLYSEKSIRTRESSHSLISSLFTLVLLKNYFDNYSNHDKIREFKELFIIAGFSIVKNHHSNLNNLSFQLGALTSKYKNQEYLMRQLSSLKKNYDYLEDIYNIIIKNNINTLDDLTFNKIFEIVEAIIEKMVNGKSENISTRTIYPEISSGFNYFKRKNKNDDLENKIFLFILIKLINSIFLEADKMDAAFDGTKELHYEILKDLPKKIHQRIDDLRNNTLDKENQIYIDRNKIFEESKSILIKYLKEENNSKVLTFNAPTGFGKTLSVINCVSELINFLNKGLNKRFKNQKKLIFNKIIYCLPFLSITDQIYNEFQKILKLESNKPSELVICHNHRTEMNYYNIDEEQFSGLDARLLIEGWNSNIIVTTFHQLFYSFFFNINMLSIKFHKIINSVVILDEIQSFPLKYWTLIREVFQTLIKKFNVKIILVSATLPMIFNEKSSFELVKDKERYFNSLDRINIFIQKKLHFELIDLLDFFIHYLKNHPEEKSFLCVFNTRRSARQFFHALNRKIDDQQNFYLFFLSSDVLIKDRQERIKIIKEYLSELRDKKKLILISTQVIEAGVDLDFNVVFRDFAPLDSLIQVAGRCNRNNSLKKKGRFFIYRLYDIENENYFSNYIYDLTLLKITRKIIFKFNNNSELNSKFLKLSENAWFEMSKKYFQKIQKEKYSTPDYSLRILNEIYKFNFFDISKKFRLIEDFSDFQFYLDINEKSNTIWKKYLDLKNERDLIKRYSKYINLKSDFESYILNYNANRAETKNIKDFMLKHKLNTSKRNFIYIPRELIGLIYDICGLNFEGF